MKMKFLLTVAGVAALSALSAGAQTLQLTDNEAKVLASYISASNVVRNQITEVHKEPDSAERQKKLDKLNAEAKIVDDQAVPAARALEARGYWAENAPRDPHNDDTVMLIVSHSGDLDLQKQTILQVTPLVAAHKYQADSYSVLYDRVQMKQGLPQHYGTQVQCVDHHYVSYKMDDESHIEDIRKGAGLPETEVEYMAYFQGMIC